LPFRGSDVPDLAVDCIGLGYREVVGAQDHHLDGSPCRLRRGFAQVLSIGWSRCDLTSEPGHNDLEGDDPHWKTLHGKRSPGRLRI
jgi:hypothetical protein